MLELYLNYTGSKGEGPVELSWVPLSRTDAEYSTRVETVKQAKQKLMKLVTKDRRRKHQHWQVTVRYRDGEEFARVYTDRKKAEAFAVRQKRSPVVKQTRVIEVD